MPPKTTQPSLPVVCSTDVGDLLSAGVYVTWAVTPATPLVATGALSASTSSAEPVGGVTMLEAVTADLFVAFCVSQVTVEVIAKALPLWRLFSLTLQAAPDPLWGWSSAFWVIV